MLLSQVAHGFADKPYRATLAICRLLSFKEQSIVILLNFLIMSKGFIIYKMRIKISFFLLFIPLITQGALSNIVINEIAWMGTTTSANDEWIELYNGAGQPINFDGWTLKSEGGTPKILLSGIIANNGFYLLERTDENTLPGVSADQIYTGALGNSGEDLKLYDNLGNLVDEVNCGSGWCAGDNALKKTMERTSLKLWQTGQNPGGTPKATNSEAAQSPPLEPTPSFSLPVTTIIAQNPPAQNYPQDIVLNEIMPSPEGADETEEWIEIFNENNFEVDVEGWKIQDIKGKIASYIFPAGAKIAGNNYLVLRRPDSKITLNNDTDGLNIFQPDGTLVNSVSFEKAIKNQSYAKIQDGWAWSNLPTPGSINLAPKTTEDGKELAAPTNGAADNDQISATNLLTNEQTASIGQKIIKKGTYIPFLLAGSIALFSSALIFVLKKFLAS